MSTEPKVFGKHVQLKRNLNVRNAALILSLGLLLSAAFCSSASAIPLNWNDTSDWIKATAEALGLPKDARSEGETVPPEDRQVLELHRPRIFVAPSGDVPIDFYRDYLPHTVVRSRSERKTVLERAPDRERLKELALHPDLYLDYESSDAVEGRAPKVYARLKREQVNLLNQGRLVSRQFTFLKYGFVFLRAGLPTLLPAYKEQIAKLFGDPMRWQELHTRGAAQIVLDERGQIAAVIVSVYDNHRTYLVGVDFELPPDGRVRIGFSLRSNQPYVLPDGNKPVHRRAVLDVREISYLITGGRAPLLAGIDLIFPAKAGGLEVGYKLEFLPSDDPLYTSRIPLGEVVYLPWRAENPLRRGPVGMAFSTWPELVDGGNLMQFWYLKNGQAAQARFMREHLRSFTDVDFDTVILGNGERFGKDFFGN